MARILSVEDDVDLQHMLAMALRLAGHDVLYAYSGEEGIQKALALEPDIVLLDMALPICDGASVLERLKAHAKGKYVPVIVLTGNWNDPRFCEEKMSAMGAVAYLKKPFRVERLRDAIAKILSHKKRPRD
ncbi:MAG: response regulator [Elusimicrobia bacterium]|nr:response regulator [Elusimicrobiota bacterium]